MKPSPQVQEASSRGLSKHLDAPVPGEPLLALPEREEPTHQPADEPSDEPTLDPTDWSDVRALGHRMLDDMFDYLQNIRERPVWQPAPPQVRARFRDPLPLDPADAASVYRDFANLILPYSNGNVHPGFMGWVHGGGSVVGMLAEMLAGGLNANLGGRDHIPVEVERQITEWSRQMFGFPEGASGLFVTGSSIANFIALLVARNAAGRRKTAPPGANLSGKHLVAYTSVAAHSCIARAMEMSGLGSASLRCIPVDAMHRIRIDELRSAIEADKVAGRHPFLIVGTAGTVDIGAIDDLSGLAELASEKGLWFHVDGALGALAILAPGLAPRLAGIERADSIAFDFHKWAQVPYDAGFVLVRDGQQHFDTFSSPAAYLQREARGLAAGSPWPCDFGPDLSRGFRALKTWFTFKVYGTTRLGAVISRTCQLAQYLKRLVEQTPELELAAPVQLNIVCFRYRAPDKARDRTPDDDAIGNDAIDNDAINNDGINAEIAADIQESGIAVTSTTAIDGQIAIRAAIVNHRTQSRDLDALVAAVLSFGRTRAKAPCHQQLQ
jgi:glutamate/tyrosine decarboxylase-like PLP-dependent enzyme